MEAHVKTVREILHSGDQFLVPFFQRHYSWGKENWQRLRDDVTALTEETDETKHFLGPLVCSPFHPVPGEVTPYQLIDGQQRLMTLTLALAALRDIAKETGLNDLADEIQEDYLIHRRRLGLQRFKVVPRLGDRQYYESVIAGAAREERGASGIIPTYSFFRREWKKLIGASSEAPAKLMVALTARLSLVTITVDSENPYEIFESLNSTGLPLEEADLIRNYLFMQVALDKQGGFHTAHWEPFELRFEASGSYEKIPPTLFYRSYLMRNGTYCRNNAVYVEFKKQNSYLGFSPELQVAELSRFAEFEIWLRRPMTCENPRLSEALAMIEALAITTAHPLILNLQARDQESQTPVGGFGTSAWPP